MYCDKCGADNLEVAKFCKSCGKQNDENQAGFVAGESCINCGKDVHGSASFCKSCGHFRQKTIAIAPPHMTGGKRMLYVFGVCFAIIFIIELFSGGFKDGIGGMIIPIVIAAVIFGFDTLRRLRG